MLRYSFSGDDILEPPPPVFEEEADWWVGLFNCGAGLALASALSASQATAQLARSFTWQDEVPVVAPYDDGGYQPPAMQEAAGIVVTIHLGEDFIPITSDDDLCGPLPPAQLWSAWTRVFADDDSIIEQAAPTIVDEDLPGPLPAPQLWPVWGYAFSSDIELFPVAPADEDFPGPFPAPQLWQVRAPVFAEGDEWPNPPAPAFVHEEDGPVIPAPHLWSAHAPLFAEGDERPAPPLVHEEAGPVVPAPRLWTLPPVQALSDTDTFQTDTVVWEEHPVSWLPPPQLWSLPPRVALTDDDTFQFPTAVDMHVCGLLTVRPEVIARALNEPMVSGKISVQEEVSGSFDITRCT